MNTFYIKLADRVFEINAIYDYLSKYCADYICQPDDNAISISITEVDIDYECAISKKTEENEGKQVYAHTRAYLETLAAYRKICEILPSYGVFLFHGSAVAVDGEAYMFTAKSGTGKSTHTRLWREKFGERAVMVNDDKPLIKFENGRAYVFGTPWNGKHRLSTNACYPLKAICILQRDTYNHIEKISKKEAFPLLMQQSYRAHDPEALVKIIDLLNRTAESTELFRLGCNMDPEAAEVSYNGMNK